MGERPSLDAYILWNLPFALFFSAYIEYLSIHDIAEASAWNTRTFVLSQIKKIKFEAYFRMGVTESRIEIEDDYNLSHIYFNLPTASPGNPCLEENLTLSN